MSILSYCEHVILCYGCCITDWSGPSVAWGISSASPSPGNWMSKISTLLFIFFLSLMAMSAGSNRPKMLTLLCCFSIRCISISFILRMILLIFLQQEGQSRLTRITMHTCPDMKEGISVPICGEIFFWWKVNSKRGMMNLYAIIKGRSKGSYFYARSGNTSLVKEESICRSSKKPLGWGLRHTFACLSQLLCLDFWLFYHYNQHRLVVFFFSGRCLPKIIYHATNSFLLLNDRAVEFFLNSNHTI